MRVLSWLRQTTEYFECVQFDRVVETMGVSPAETNRYSLRSRVGTKAFTNAKKRTIRFDRKWFLGLSPKARCAVLAHEVWHIVTLNEKIRARNRYLLYIFPGGNALNPIHGNQTYYHTRLNQLQNRV